VEGGGREFLPPEPAGPEPDLSVKQAWAPPAAASQAPPPPAWQPRGYAPATVEPDNGAAVAGFVTSVASAALLVMSFGFLGVVTMIAAPFGIHYSRKGKQAVRDGRTRQHAGLAQAGFVIGIIALVLSVLATVLLILLIVGAVGDADFDLDPDGGGGQGDGFDSTSAGFTLAVLRTGARLVA
jgi:hypothetical protein